MLLISQNVFWFQGHPSPKPHRHIVDQEIFDRLISLYQEYDPDLICLQEIQSMDVAKRVADAMGMNFSYASGGLLKPYGGVILWKHSVLCTPIETDAFKDFQRFCQLVKVKDSFVLANLHLPSQAQLSEEESYAKRLEEIQCLLNHSYKVDAITGDFNEEAQDRLDTFLTQAGFVDSIVKLKSECQYSTVWDSKGDFFRIREKHLNILESLEICDLKQSQLKTSSDRFLSDHFPLLVKLSF